MNKVRLGYPAAPRKADAAPHDAKELMGRDRLVKNKKQQDEEMPTRRRAVFANNGAAAVKLFWEQTFFADLAPGKDLQVDTFVGHKWNVAAAAEEGEEAKDPHVPSSSIPLDDGGTAIIIETWVVTAGRELQRFAVK